MLTVTSKLYSRPPRMHLPTTTDRVNALARAALGTHLTDIVDARVYIQLSTSLQNQLLDDFEPPPRSRFNITTANGLI